MFTVGIRDGLDEVSEKESLGQTTHVDPANFLVVKIPSRSLGHYIQISGSRTECIVN